MPYKDSEKQREYYQKNKEKIQAQKRKRYQEDPEYRAAAVERERDWRKNNPEKAREISLKSKRKRRKENIEYQLMRNYGLTLEDIEVMMENQGRRCRICTILLDEDSRGPQVDHCHDTGRVRGILCFKCNTALGFLQDSVENLKRAIEYLER
jgi:hypothetical protein